MEEKKQGGKRRGAGRKPILHKKKQISLYVEGSKILKFGNVEKYKEFLYRQTDEYGVEKDYSNPVSELNKLPQYSVHDIKQPLATFSTPISYTEPVKPQTTFKTVAQWIQEKRELESEDEFHKWEAKLDADTLLTDKQKKAIKIS